VPSIGDDVLNAAATWLSLKRRNGRTTVTYSGLYQTLGVVKNLVESHGFPLPIQGVGVQTWVFDRAEVDAWASDVLAVAELEHAALLSRPGYVAVR